MEKYYFKRHHEVRSICMERCQVLRDGTRIGSVECQKCEFCIEYEIPTTHFGGVNWIRCGRLKEALDENGENKS